MASLDVKCLRYKSKEINTVMKCPNLKEDYSDMDVEVYRCKVCGETIRLYYDDMR